MRRFIAEPAVWPGLEPAAGHARLLHDRFVLALAHPYLPASRTSSAEAQPR